MIKTAEFVAASPVARTPVFFRLARTCRSTQDSVAACGAMPCSRRTIRDASASISITYEIIVLQALQLATALAKEIWVDQGVADAATRTMIHRMILKQAARPTTRPEACIDADIFIDQLRAEMRMALDAFVLDCRKTLASISLNANPKSWIMGCSMPSLTPRPVSWAEGRDCRPDGR